ncbi:LysE family translocator [Photobacterium galatheae]|uniref:Threonine transporter n=1 Tax=Photobacterium galatheae TaxID=1654360 RepID=A0A066S1A1_9GAMM|nr:LysE family translocator [Photobacterium galatheae]KDM93428.1 hypothetical protein EA58_00755 [Photobacterium galatheae]MCM0147008.1 LysE family translocator [Photobacterium galatheae]
MTTTELFIAWFAVMFPLVISPGPANIVFAISGAKSGLKRSLPLVAGIDLIFLVYSIIIGFGFGLTLQKYPQYFQIIQLAGATYLIYLSYKFIKPTQKKDTDKKDESQKTFFSFWDGIVIQLLNPKGLVMLVLMFSLFTTPESSMHTTLSLIVWLCILNVSAHILWVIFGSHILSRWSSGRSEKLQSFFYAFSLISVAVWIIFDAINK